MPLNSIKPIDASLLKDSVDEKQFKFKDTSELEPLEFVGQHRAIKAAQFGIAIDQEGFNIYALGPSGIGKRFIIKSLLKKEALKHKPPKDITYIHNFKNDRYPRVLLLPPGLGKQLATDMDNLIDILKTTIPAIFESKAYISKIKEIQKDTQQKQEKALNDLQDEAAKDDVAIGRTREGFVLAPTKEGKVLSEEEFQSLPKNEQEERQEKMRRLHDKLESYLEYLAKLQKEEREKVKDAINYFTMLQVGSVINEVRNKYTKYKEVLNFLADVQQAILDNPFGFQKKKENFLAPLSAEKDDHYFNRFRVNVLVDNSKLKGAPIIYEDNPKFINLFGSIEYVSQLGALVTDFTLIRSGAIHRANGGYLLIDALKALSEPFVWDTLKRILLAKKIRVENIGQLYGYMNTASLKPEKVRLHLKVILLGSRRIYHLLSHLDPDFMEIFKVAADFDEEIKKDLKNNLKLAQMFKSIADKNKLNPLSKGAVAQIIDYGARINHDKKKISTHIRKLSDLIKEANHYCLDEDKSIIEKDHVKKAIDAQIFRASRIKEKSFEQIQRKTILIEVEKERVGQVNGLSVFSFSDFLFGHPVRITARVGLGHGQLIDIEREVKLSGPIHSKGVLILTGYLNGHYVKESLLSLSASLVFEQSYGGVDGDSASVAEACALLSAISNIPLKQSIAITGSMNQHGDVQAVGGVNEKIESFFEVCKNQGLSGDQGVIIPAVNIDMLMLKDEVIEAVRKNKFHIYAITKVDEAMEILTGIKAGTRNKQGNFPKKSVNGLVEGALQKFATIRKKYMERPKKNK